MRQQQASARLRAESGGPFRPGIMKFLCALLKHKWEGCRCRRCGLKRNTGHSWNGCMCRRCGVRRNAGHSWVGCTCTLCGEWRNEGHRWQGCVCRICGRRQHRFDSFVCSVCGERASMDDISKHLSDVVFLLFGFARLSPHLFPHLSGATFVEPASGRQKALEDLWRLRPIMLRITNRDEREHLSAKTAEKCALAALAQTIGVAGVQIALTAGPYEHTRRREVLIGIVDRVVAAALAEEPIEREEWERGIQQLIY